MYFNSNSMEEDILKSGFTEGVDYKFVVATWPRLGVGGFLKRANWNRYGRWTMADSISMMYILNVGLSHKFWLWELAKNIP